MCLRHTTEDGEPSAVNLIVSHHSQTLDPGASNCQTIKGGGWGEVGGRGASDSTHASCTWLTHPFLYPHCAHTGMQRSIFVKYALMKSLDKSVLAS